MVIIVSLIFWFRNKENNNYINRGEELINTIEVFRSEHNRLPNTIEELEFIENDDGPYYTKKDSLNYIVYFIIGFDNTKKYYSEIKKWKDEP